MSDMKEPGQIAFEAKYGCEGLYNIPWLNCTPAIKASWAAVETACRAATLEEAARCATIEADKAYGSDDRAMGLRIIRAIRALSPSPAAPSSPVASGQSELPPGSAGQG